MKNVIKYLGILILLMPFNSYSEIKQIILKVKGLDNDFCAYSLGKKLTSFENIKEARINPGNKTATLTLRDNKRVSLANLESLLKNTSFKIEGYKIVAVGKIEKNDSNFIFSIKENPYKIYLMPEREEFEGNEKEKKTLSLTSKIKTKIIDLFSSTVKKLTPSERLHHKIKDYYDKNSDVEIVCNIHQHRNGFLLGLADDNARITAINSKWLQKNS